MDNRCSDFVFDNDIAGIGVRIAIYVQNILVFFPVIWNVVDGYVSKSELESIEKQSIAILVIAFAILIATIVQARAFGMSNFHAAVVLDLSWMNNICTFVWFLLYLHHRTKPTPTMPLTWNDLWPVVIKWLKSTLRIGEVPTKSDDKEAGDTPDRKGAGREDTAKQTKKAATASKQVSST